LPTRLNFNYLLFNNDYTSFIKETIKPGFSIGTNMSYDLNSLDSISIGGRLDTSRKWTFDTAENIFGKNGSPYLININYNKAINADYISINSIEVDTLKNIILNSGITKVQ
jgi:hypothetical protein